MKLCTTFGDVRTYCRDWSEMIEALAQAGFRYQDFNFFVQNRPGSLLWREDWWDLIRYAGETAARLDVKLVQAHSPDFNYDPGSNSDKQRLGFQGVLRALEACAYLGIGEVVIHASIDRNLRYPEDMEAFFAHNFEYFRLLMPYAEKYRVSLLVENSSPRILHGKCYFMTGQELKKFITRFNHPLLHACWDIGHANLNGRDQYEDLMILGDDLRALHIQDNFGTSDVHIAPYMGTINMDSVMTALKELGTVPYFTFESGYMLSPYNPVSRLPRRPCPEGIEPRLLSPGKELMIHAERFLYDIGKYILSSYDMCEE